MSNEGQGQVSEAKAKLRALRALVDDQARDPGLWFISVTASEAYLQAALRRLHAAIEEP